jgi:hypothetical protein
VSNRRKLRHPRPQHPLDALLASLDGAQLPGGCGRCDAYHVVHAHGYGGSVHRIAVYHDDDCPVLAAHTGEAS